MPITIAELASALGAKAVGDTNMQIDAPCEPLAAAKGLLALAMSEKYKDDLQASGAEMAILWDGADWQALGLKAAIFSLRARYTLSGVSDVFHVDPLTTTGIHPAAIVDPTARIGTNPSIGPFVVIGANVQIGDNCRILSHSSIAENAVIGDNALIYEGVRIRARVRIGNDFIAQSNAVIGGDGFSFVSPEAGAIEQARSLSSQITTPTEATFARINSLGTVVIGDNVEIGSNTTIDRGTIANTTIGDGTKLDNLVQVGHNVQIGQHCLLCGMVGIAGSVTLKDRVVLAGNVVVADQVVMGENTVATMSATVLSNVPANRVVMGYPAVKMDTNVESYKAIRRLPRLARKVDELQKQVSNLEPKE